MEGPLLILPSSRESLRPSACVKPRFGLDLVWIIGPVSLSMCSFWKSNVTLTKTTTYSIFYLSKMLEIFLSIFQMFYLIHTLCCGLEFWWNDIELFLKHNICRYRFSKTSDPPDRRRRGGGVGIPVWYWKLLDSWYAIHVYPSKKNVCLLQYGLHLL